jgi:hypothetical protein
MPAQCLVAAFATQLLLGSAAISGDLESVDVKFMLRGYCLAGSRVDEAAPGLFGTSNNAPERVTDQRLGDDGQVSLIALPTEHVPFAKKFRGMRLLLVNLTKSEVGYLACDSRLSIVQEALTAEGQWKPIEYLPSSFCGNSYHRVFLPVGHFWEFAAPLYTGPIRTKLRFVLTVEGGRPLYSNTFEASINAEQFTRKQGHNPTSIMDPYQE